MKKSNLFLLAVALLAAVTLIFAGCGGGDDTSTEYELVKKYEWGKTASLKAAGDDHSWTQNAEFPLETGDYVIRTWDDADDPATISEAELGTAYIQTAITNATAGGEVRFLVDPSNYHDEEYADKADAGGFAGVGQNAADDWVFIFSHSKKDPLLTTTDTNKGYFAIDLDEFKKLAAPAGGDFPENAIPLQVWYTDDGDGNTVAEILGIELWVNEAK